MRTQLLLLLSVLALFCQSCTTVNGTNFYISNQGSDRNHGRTPDNAWKSISKLSGANIHAGDTIFLERGSVWRETLTLNYSGTKAGYIVITAYGNNTENPVIKGSEVTKWAPSGVVNVWKSEKTFAHNPRSVRGEYGNIWFELARKDTVVWGEFRQYDEQLTALNTTYDFAYANGKVYIYSEGDPNSDYTNIEVCQRNACISLNDHDYIEINGVDVHYASNAGIWEKWPTSKRDGLIVRNCNIGYIGVKDSPSAYGIYTWHSNFLCEKNIIHDCGRRGVSYFGSSNSSDVIVKHAIIQDNIFYNGWHTTALDLIVERGSNVTIDSVIFRRNLVYETPVIKRGVGGIPNSNHVFIANQSGPANGRVKNIYIYNNVFKYAPGSSVKTEHVENLYVYNNTFYKFNPNVSNFQSHVQISGDPSGGTYSSIVNNIFYHNGRFTTNNNLQCIKIDKDLVEKGTDIDYNLYFSEDPNARIVTFYPPSMVAFNMGSWILARKGLGFDQNAPAPGRLLLNENTEYLELKPGSPAIGTGKSVSWITNDFSGIQRPDKPSLGANEYKR